MQPTLQSSFRRMDRDRIAELLHPFLSSPIPCSGATAQLSSLQLDRISTYIDILIRWNARLNLTAIRNYEDVVARHFGESLFAARVLFPVETARPAEPSGSSLEPASAAAADSVADLGSGAGFPGLPIKLWAPHISLTLIESNHKKATFLREVTRALTLTDVNIQNARAETLAGSAFQVVTLRAVERFETILPIASRLLAPASRLALLISGPQAAQARKALPDLRWDAPLPIPHSTSRILFCGHRT